MLRTGLPIVIYFLLFYLTEFKNNNPINNHIMKGVFCVSAVQKIDKFYPKQREAIFFHLETDATNFKL